MKAAILRVVEVTNRAFGINALFRHYPGFQLATQAKKGRRGTGSCSFVSLVVSELNEFRMLRRISRRRSLCLLQRYTAFRLV
jgi:hypothetical protein